MSAAKNIRNQNRTDLKPLDAAVFLRAACATAMLYTLCGCGVAATPCDIASSALDTIPVVGPIAAIPTEACSSLIDP